MKRRIFSIFTAVILLLSLTSPALAAQPLPVQVQLNGKTISCTPVLLEGRTFLPADQLFSALDIEYSISAHSVTARRGDTTLTLTAGSKTGAMELAPYEESGVLWVPVRFAAEAFGCNVGWDADYRTVLMLDVDALTRSAQEDGLHTLATELPAAPRADAPSHTLSPALALLVKAAGVNMDGLYTRSALPAGRGPIATALSALPLDNRDSAWPMAEQVLNALADDALRIDGDRLLSTAKTATAYLAFSMNPTDHSWFMKLSATLDTARYGVSGYGSAVLELYTGSNTGYSALAALPGSGLSVKVTG